MTKKNEGKRAYYRGPSIHNRVISKQDLLDAEIPEDQIPKDFEGFRWAPMPQRRSADLSGFGDSVIEIFDNDPAFEVRNKDDEIISEAHVEANHVYADGSFPGYPGDEALKDVLGESEGFEAAQANAGSSGSTVGGSTAGSTAV